MFNRNYNERSTLKGTGGLEELKAAAGPSMFGTRVTLPHLQNKNCFCDNYNGEKKSAVNAHKGKWKYVLR